jgi:hypothetical protein
MASPRSPAHRGEADGGPSRQPRPSGRLTGTAWRKDRTRYRQNRRAAKRRQRFELDRLGRLAEEDQVGAVVAAAAALGREDSLALDSLAGEDLSLGEHAVAGEFQTGTDAGDSGRVDQRRRGEARRCQLLAPDRSQAAPLADRRPPATADSRPPATAAPGPPSPLSRFQPTAPRPALEPPHTSPQTPRPPDPVGLSVLSFSLPASPSPRRIPTPFRYRSHFAPSPLLPDDAADHRRLHRECVWSAASKGLKAACGAKWLRTRRPGVCARTEGFDREPEEVTDQRLRWCHSMSLSAQTRAAPIMGSSCLIGRCRSLAPSS